jgi:hypothetical protein
MIHQHIVQLALPQAATCADVQRDAAFQLQKFSNPVLCKLAGLGNFGSRPDKCERDLNKLLLPLLPVAL